MSNQDKTIKVPAADWQRFARLQRAERAIARLRKSVQESLGLPESNLANLGQWVIADGNGSPVGKFTVYERAGFQMPACIIGKVT